MKSIYEKTGKGYTQQGDYVLQNVEVEELFSFDNKKIAKTFKIAE